MKTDTKALSSFSIGGNPVNGSQLSEPLGQSRGPGSAEAAEGRVCMVLAGWELLQPLRPKPGHQRPLSWRMRFVLELSGNVLT